MAGDSTDQSDVGSTDREQQLVEEVQRAGGSLQLTADELGGRMGIEIVQLTDAYTQHALRTRLGGMGLTVEYQPARDSVTLHGPRGTRVAQDAKPSPGPAPVTPAAEQPWAAPPRPNGVGGTPPPGTAKQIWGATYAVATAIANLVPSFAYELVPGGKLEGKNITFLLVYLQTLPLSLAVTGIFLINARELFDNNQERFAASCALLFFSSVVGIGVGSSQADLEFLSQVHGNGFAILAELALYALAAYAFVYGPVLYVAGIIAGCVAGLWVHEKLGPT